MIEKIKSINTTEINHQIEKELNELKINRKARLPEVSNSKNPLAMKRLAKKKEEESKKAKEPIAQQTSKKVTITDQQPLDPTFVSLISEQLNKKPKGIIRQMSSMV